MTPQPQPHDPSLMALHCPKSRRGSRPESKEQYGNVFDDYGTVVAHERGAMDEEDKSKAKATEFEKEVWAYFVAHDLRLAALAREVEYMLRQMQRFNEVYYHVFPDRYEKDQQFEDQLDALKYPPKPDSTQK